MGLQLDPSQYQQLGHWHQACQIRAVLQQHWPQAGLPKHDWIRAQTEHAIRHGLLDSQSAALFVVTAWLLGEGFEQRIPAMQQVLTSTELDAHDKGLAMQAFTELVFASLYSTAQP